LLRLMGAEACAGRLDSGLAQAAQRVGQAIEAPVEAVVVGQAAAIEASRLQGRDVGGVHAEVHAFSRPGPWAGGDRCFQIH
jgi:pyrimidine deaminase RibD-like protein